MTAQRYDVLVARKYQAGGEERTSFTKVGVAFPLKEKDGFSIQLEAIPAPQDGVFRLVMMPPKPKDDAPRQSAGRADLRQDMDDEIPF